ncbi:hypothetical protein CO615_02530 [Lysobacteraceae bacterium NML75-0749]|nr:hypothetical protein CO615_02530 [Xanthomonadaceae bacterium NML75-0749]PJK02892.1 hypothetical protein CO609_08485 [Xanthomonadaceae bacterium NML91-0268]
MRITASRLAIIAFIAITTAGCGILYKQPIYQGTLIDPASAEQLQVGMSRQQVASMLGTPSIADPFHQNRWDYTSSIRRGRTGKTEVNNFVVHFENDLVTRWEGDYFPNQDAELARRSVREFGPNLRRERNQRGR